MRRREFWTLMTPSLVVMFGLLIVPLYLTITWSFQNVSFGQPGRWVGWSNYTTALTDPRFRSAVGFTVVLTLVCTAAILVLGYVIAVLLNGLKARTRAVALGFLLIPYVMPQVVGSAAYSWLVDSNFGGPVTHLVSALTGHQVHWFSDPWANRLLVFSNVVWQMVPFALLMILAALQGVSRELLDAAEMDGTNRLQRHRYVIIPGIRGVLGFITLILIMDIFRIFDNLIPLSPSATTVGNESVMLYIYNIAFKEGSAKLGLGSAVSVLSIIVMGVLLLPSIRSILKGSRGA